MALKDLLISDLDTLLDADDFAVSAVFTHGGTPATIKIIFDAEYVPLNLGGVEVESASPAATCKSSDVSSAAHGDTLVINSITYYIRGIQPDGTGMTVLILSKE